MTPILLWVLILLVLISTLFIYYYLLSKRRTVAVDRKLIQLTRSLDAQTESQEIQRTRWNAASSALEEALIFIDSDLNVSYASPAATKIFGDLPDFGVSVVSYTHSEEFEIFCHDAVATATHNELLEWQTKFQDNIFQVRALMFEDGAVLALRDISRFHRLDRARRDMFANISHELRTPLTSIRLLLDLLQSHDHTHDSTDTLRKIGIEIDALHQMAQELLDISRIESGKSSIRMVAISAAELIQPSIERLRPQAKYKAIEVHQEEMSEIQVLADLEQMQQALGNVIHNAIKFTPPNGHVTIRAIDEAEYVRIEIQDSGPGIPPHEVTRLFERFFRGDRGRFGAGTGLGLAIAKHVVQAHGGEISIENCIEVGAKASIRLMRADLT